MRPLTNYLQHPKLIRAHIASNIIKLHQGTILNSEIPRSNLTFFQLKKFHLWRQNYAKLFIDYENKYAYNILPPIQKFQVNWNPPKEIKRIEEFNDFLDQNWRGSTATEIVEAFEKIKTISIENNIPISDKRFDKLVDGLMDHCEKLKDEELLRLLIIFLDYPPCEASDSHNFHDVWSCLDDMCCWKMGNWNLQKMYSFAEIWYKLHLGRLSDFIYEVLDKVVQKPQRLSNNMLLYTCFYINVNRRKTVSYEFEHTLAQRIQDFNVDQLAIIAMCYFKTKTKIKTPKIVQAMVSEISQNCETINEIALSAMLKVIRLSQRVELANEIPLMLDKIEPHINRFSNLALIHIALLGTSLQIKHESSIKKCIERFLQDVDSLRLKDIERALLVCSMFNMETEFYSIAAKEILKESRRKEFIQYNRSLPSTLNYLSQRQIYSYELMSEILNEEFINETYGKTARNLPRDLFSLDCCIEVECLDYKGNRLNPQKRYKAAKWLSEYAPSVDQYKKLSLSDKAYLGVTEAVVSVVGEERLLRHDHVLPHFSKPDIILCKNLETGEFVEPFGFQNYYLGDIKRPFELNKFKWFAIMVLTPNLTIRDSCLPLGNILMKERQLKIIGYNPIQICTNFFGSLSVTERTTLLERQLV